ncbi:AAA family ATPase [Bosea beijingensis]
MTDARTRRAIATPAAGNATDRFVVISGCSGGGKSTLIEELRRHHYAVVEEPGRRIVSEELAGNGKALPWINLQAFARRAIATTLRDRSEASLASGWVFFDRGLVDAAAALEHATGEPAIEEFGTVHRYHGRVFLAPPWPEIYRKDDKRRHDFSDATAEYDRLQIAYSRLGYELEILPKIGVEQRAHHIIQYLSNGPSI